jgi:hypothetical protein
MARSNFVLPYAIFGEAAAETEWISSVIDRLVALAQRGLPTMYRAEHHEFVQTVRRDATVSDGVVGEGENLRYAAIAALGVSRLSLDAQRQVLSGRTARQLAELVAARGVHTEDLGAAALCSWAATEIVGGAPPALIRRITDQIKSGQPAPTVDLSWALTALVGEGADVDPALPDQLADRILLEQSASGVFPHAVPRQSLGRYRAHVSCFADQVYPIQALSRYYAATGDNHALAAANRCADQIVRLQGRYGQWWWHYDARTGDVIEQYPVYSVHQHAMAPMALSELAGVGGHDHTQAVVAGLDWLRTHPETSDELIDEWIGVIWRKVGRREPRKAARALRATATSVRPGTSLSALDRIFPPGRIDYECRPYELGWLLYTWLPADAGDTRPTSGGDPK